jgi:hypothetical protein
MTTKDQQIALTRLRDDLDRLAASVACSGRPRSASGAVHLRSESPVSDELMFAFVALSQSAQSGSGRCPP